MSNAMQRVTGVLVALLLGTGAGCAGYRLGSNLPPGIKSVYVPTFENRTGEPNLEFETTNATRTEIQKDGTLRVERETDADSVLKVVITEYDLSPLRYEADRRTTVEEMRLRLTVSVELVEQATGKAIVRRDKVRGESTFELVGDLGSAKRSALPEAARDLAHDIVEAIAEAW